MLRTRSGLPKHCGWNIDRADGKRRVRFRKSGFSTYLKGIPWSEDFMRQYAAALEGVKARAENIGAVRTIPGSFDAACVSYYRSPDFRGLKASTQRVRRNVIERFQNEHEAHLPARSGAHQGHHPRQGEHAGGGEQSAEGAPRPTEPCRRDRHDREQSCHWREAVSQTR